MAVPIAAAVLASIAFSRVVSYPRSFAEVAAWWVAVLVLSTVVLTVVDRWARRLLPLAALLKISMLFPDEAPSRFGMALKSGTVKNLEERIEQVRLHGVDDEPSRAARQILELVGMLNAHDPRRAGTPNGCGRSPTCWPASSSSRRTTATDCIGPRSSTTWAR